MNKKKKLCTMLALTCALALPAATLAGCRDKTPEEENPPIVTPAVEITLNKTSVELDLHEEVQLTASCSDTSLELVWSSSDSSVATVSENGLVKSVKAGSVTITVTAGEATAACAVTVKNSMNAPTLKLDAADGKAFVNKDGELTITAQVLYKGAPVSEAVTLGWTLADGAAEDVISITPDANTLSAVVKGLEYGETRIQVSALVWGTPLAAYVDVKVCNTDITFELNNLDPAEGGYSARLATLATGEHISEKTVDITVKNKGEAISSPAIEWESSDATVASVSADGKITALKAGNVTITGTYENNNVRIFLEVYLPELEISETVAVETKNGGTLVLGDAVVGTPEEVLLGGTEALGSYDGATGTVTLKAESLPTASASMGKVTLSVQTDKAIYNYTDASVYSKIISTKEELNSMESYLTKSAGEDGGSKWDGYIVLGADIDFGGDVYNSFIRWETQPIIGDWHDGFIGVFDGMGHIIDNMKSDGKGAGGFIGQIGENGIVKNVAFTNAVHMGYSGFVCSHGVGTVQNVYVSYKELHEGRDPDRTGTFFVRDAMGDARIINCFVEVQKVVGSTDNIYAIGAKHEMTSIAQNVYAVGLAKDNGFFILSDAIWDGASEHFGAYESYDALKAAEIDFSNWDTSFWKVVDGVPYPKSLEIAETETASLTATVTATNAKSGAAVDLTGKEITFTGLMGSYTAEIGANGAVSIANVIKQQYDVKIEGAEYLSQKATFDGTALTLTFSERKATMNATVGASVILSDAIDVNGKKLTFTAEGIETFELTVADGAISKENVIYGTYSVAINDDRFDAIEVTFAGEDIAIAFAMTGGGTLTATDHNITVADSEVYGVCFGGEQHNWVVTTNTYSVLEVTESVSMKHGSYKAWNGVQLVFGDGNGVFVTLDSDPEDAAARDGLKLQLVTDIRGCKYAITGETLHSASTLYTFTQGEVDKWASNAGLELTVLRAGGIVKIYVEGELVHTLTLPDAYAAEECKIAFFSEWSSNTAKYYFKVEDPVLESIGVTASGLTAIEHGTVALDKAAYKYGDAIYLTVTPAADYTLRSITVGEATYYAQDLKNGKLFLGYATEAVSYAVSAQFIENRDDYDVTVTADGKWGADGLVITFKKGDVTKTATLGDSAHNVIEGMAIGEWEASTVVAGLKVALGSVTISSDACSVDFTNAFGGIIVGGELGEGKLIYATGNSKSIDFELANAAQGNMYFATKVKLDKETVAAGNGWTNLAVRFTIGGATHVADMMYSSASGNDFEKMYVWEASSSGWHATAYFSDEVNNALKNGQETIFVWAYNAETGSIDIYAGASLETVKHAYTIFGGGAAKNSTVTQIGFSDPWGGAVQSNIEVGFGYGDTLSKALGIYEDIIVDKTVTGEGTVSVTENAKRGDDVTVSVNYNAETHLLKTLTINGESYLDKLKDNKVTLSWYVKENLAIVAEFIEATELDVTVTADGKWGADGLVITLKRDDVTKTVTLGDDTKNVIEGMELGVWEASTEIAGLKVSLGSVTVSGETCEIDFTNAFNGAVVGGELSKGTFLYKTDGTAHEPAFMLETNAAQGDLYVATKFKLPTEADQNAVRNAGRNVTFSLMFEVDGKQREVSFLYGAHEANPPFYPCVDLNGWDQIGGAQELAQNLLAGQEIVFVWVYKSETGCIDVYAGATAETIVKCGSLCTSNELKLPTNGTVTKLGLGDGIWGANGVFSIETSLCYGDTIGKALGIYEDITVDTTGVTGNGTVSVTENAKRGDDVTVTVSYDADTQVLKSLTINGENYLNSLKDNQVTLPMYLKEDLVITAEFVQQIKTDLSATISTLKTGVTGTADGLTVKLTGINGLEASYSGTVGASGALAIEKVIQGDYRVEIDGYYSQDITFEGDALTLTFNYKRFEGNGIENASNANNAEASISFGGIAHGYVVTKDSYNDVAVTAHYRKDDGSYNELQGIQLVFGDGKGITLGFETLDSSVKLIFRQDGIDGQNFAVSGSLTGWVEDLTDCKPMKEEWYNKYASATGVKVTLTRHGSCLMVYVEDTLVKTLYFNGSYADEACRVVFFNCWGGKADLAFEITDTVTAYEAQTVTATGIDSVENGTVALDKAAYTQGDAIYLSVTPAAGYLLKTLTVGGTDRYWDVNEGKLYLGVAGENNDYAVVAEFIAESTTAETTFTVNENIDLTGVVVTLKQGETIKTFTGEKDKTSYSVAAMSVGEWEITAEMNGLVMSFGIHRIYADGTIVLDFFRNGTFTGGSFNAGEFTYATGNQKTVEFELSEPIQGNAFFAATLTLDKDTIIAGKNWTCFGLSLEVGGAKYIAPMMFNTDPNNTADYNKGYIYAEPSWSGSSGNYSDAVNQALLNGEPVIFVWAYNAETGSMDIYWGVSTESMQKANSVYGNIAKNGTVTKITFCDPWGGSVKSNIELTLSYGSTLNEALGITE